MFLHRVTLIYIQLLKVMSFKTQAMSTSIKN